MQKNSTDAPCPRLIGGDCSCTAYCSAYLAAQKPPVDLVPSVLKPGLWLGEDGTYYRLLPCKANLET